MSSSAKQRLQDQPAFVLHSYPFRETSLLLEVFSRNHGRLPLVARGARRPRSALRGLLMNFQQLGLAVADALRFGWVEKGKGVDLRQADRLHSEDDAGQRRAQ